jgi:heat shock protein HslJ
MSKFLSLVLGTAAILAMLATGCGVTKTNDDTNPPASMPALSSHSLANTSWVLVSYGDPANLKSVIAGTKITLSFNAATDQISGNGGVNGYGGDARRTDNELTLTRIIHTLMASTNQAVNEQENAYFTLLGNAQSVSFGEDSLTIHCQGGQVLNFNVA